MGLELPDVAPVWCRITFEVVIVLLRQSIWAKCQYRGAMHTGVSDTKQLKWAMSSCFGVVDAVPGGVLAGLT